MVASSALVAWSLVVGVLAMAVLIYWGLHRMIDLASIPSGDRRRAMTLAPLVNPTVHGVKGKPVRLGDDDLRPSCLSPEVAAAPPHVAEELPHGQPYEWVSVNGDVYANSVGLCMPHHDDVTGGPGGHRAHIRFNEGMKLFEWWEQDSTDETGGASDLYTRPATRSSLSPRLPSSARKRDSVPRVGSPPERHRVPCRSARPSRGR